MNHGFYARNLLVFIGCLTMATFAGCGDADGLDRRAVAGQVTFDGQPLPDGDISFSPTDGTRGPAVGGKITDGRYKLPRHEGPVAGAHRVEIRATRKTGRQIVDAFKTPPDNLVDEVEQYVPRRYNTQSELKANTGAPTANLDFHLQASPGK